jgi:hypothetical protein
MLFRTDRGLGTPDSICHGTKKACRESSTAQAHLHLTNSYTIWNFGVALGRLRRPLTDWRRKVRTPRGKHHRLNMAEAKVSNAASVVMARVGDGLGEIWV